MTTEKHNCEKCGTELTSGNSFSCSGCGRSDLCILHKGPSSGLCSVCLQRLRKRIIYPTFAVIAGLLLIFSPYVLKTISPVFVFLLILLLPFWLLIESLRPVTTTKMLWRISLNTAIVAIIMLLTLIIAWDITLVERNIQLTAGTVPMIFLLAGVILILLGFVYLLTMSLTGLGVRIFNYDYPEETSILLRNASHDPEMVGVLRWDLRWITWVNFIYGFAFVYMYLISAAR